MLLLCPHDGLRPSLIYYAPSGQEAVALFRSQTGPPWRNEDEVYEGPKNGTREKEWQYSNYIQITTTLTALNILSYFAKFADKLWLNY